MKLRLCVLAAVCLAPFIASSSLAQQKSDAASKVLALEAKWNEAYKRGDIATMNSLLAGDFIITVEDGATYSKAGYIAHTSGGATVVEPHGIGAVAIIEQHTDAAAKEGTPSS